VSEADSPPAVGTFRWIETEREGPIGFLTLNRPDKRNALSAAMRREMVECLEAWREDEAVVVGVILARGPVFCAGFDRSEFEGQSADRMGEVFAEADHYHRVLAEFDKPLLAGIQGAAVAGGFDLAALCDVRLAAPQATFGHPEIKFGASVLYGPLREAIGGGRARELALTGRTIDAAEAYRLGFVCRLVPAAELRAACRTAARQIAEAPPTTLRAVKGRIIEAYGGWEGLSGRR